MVPASWQHHAIQFFQFTVGQGKYVNRARGRFLFGETKPIILSELKSEFDSVIHGRDYIMAFHGSTEDIRVIRTSQLPLQLGKYGSPSSETLLELLGISFYNLHAAGNDAHFIMKALLMLAVQDARTQYVAPTEAVTEILISLEAVRSPSPVPQPKPPPKPGRPKQPSRPSRRKRRAQEEGHEDLSEKPGKNWKQHPLQKNSPKLVYH